MKGSKNNENYSLAYKDDSKAIEDKALNYFKTFIEDSKVVSQYIADNDEWPGWDGHLYLYSDGIRDKKHLDGRVPVQVRVSDVTVPPDS